jgi:ribosomal protein S18 acetylase RimI-like enzyme
MDDPALTQACEERIINCWPAIETMVFGDFVLRFANGYSGRANAATAIRHGADMPPDDLAELVRLYAAAGIVPRIRTSPLVAPALIERLTRAGWINEVTSIGMVMPLRGRAFARDSRVEISGTLDDLWIEGVCQRQPPEKQDAATFRAMMERLRVTAGFARLWHEGEPAALGLTALDRGFAEIGSVIVDGAVRGRGMGRALVESQLAWAMENGAERAFLQVDSRNAVAIGLYRSLGYRELYRYGQYVPAA